MQGIEISACNSCIQALLNAYYHVLSITPAEALQRVYYGKSDTLGFDALPEIRISDTVKGFDRFAIFITEETDEETSDRWPSSSNPLYQPLMFFSDPTDRSKQFGEFIKSMGKGEREVSKNIIEFIQEGAEEKWKGMFEAPASITGSTTSLTCIRKGEIVFSIIVNYITQEIFVACKAGIKYLSLKGYSKKDTESINLNKIILEGTELIFPSCKNVCKEDTDERRFVTFLGKEGYKENLENSMIFIDNPENFLHHREPGGPSRILYLSKIQENPIVGFVLANGEKIVEWVHWLPFVKYAESQKGKPALRIFEVAVTKPLTKEGILMSNTAPYSIFQQTPRGNYMDLSRLKNFDTPSRFRSMLVVTRADNDRIVYTMHQHGYREVGNCL